MTSWTEGLVPTYALPVIVGLLLTVLYPTTPQVQDVATKRGYKTLLLVTFGFGILGAKMVALLGDHGAQGVLGLDVHGFVFSGRSIVGGLLFGHLASEIARHVIGYTALPNDRLVVGLCLGIAVGRVGCSLSGCCLGVPADGSAFALVDSAGMARVAIAPFECLLHLGLAAMFFRFEKKGMLLGRLFSLYLVVYGVVRFATEPLRETPKNWGGLSFYEWMCIALVVTGVVGLVVRSTSPLWRARIEAVRVQRGLSRPNCLPQAVPAQAEEVAS